MAAILGIGALAHAVDMFNYPFYQQDEGTYISQAWSVFHLGHLAPYTYWYDHPPAGWIQLGALLQLFGQVLNVPSDIEAGRIVMLGFQVGSMALLYAVARGLGRSTAAATVAVLAFALSPYGLVFHRRILLDNIASFWLLASLAPLVARRLTLSRVWMSALMLGIGVLSKEILIVAVPALAVLVAVRADRSQRSLATLGWLVLVLSISSLWLLFAMLKGELLPPGAPLSGSGGHVSLIETLLVQAARGRDGGILEAGSHFWQTATWWLGQDPLLVAGGTAASAMAALSIRRARSMGALGLAVLSLWVFLGRGGVTLDFYLVPLLPLLALEVAWAFDGIRAQGRRLPDAAVWHRALDHRFARATAAGVLSVSVVLTGTGSLVHASDRAVLWSSPQASTQRAAISWVRATLPPDSTMVIDMFAWPDLHEPTVPAPSFPRAEYYWKVEEDPAIRSAILKDDWRNVDYVMATPDMVGDASQLPFVQTILDHADVIRRIDQGGWPVLIERTRTLRRLPATSDQLLSTLWASWRAAVLPTGSVASAVATPDSLAMAMAAAVYMNDRATYDALWGRARGHLLGSDGLVLPGHGGVRDPGADTDLAVALLLAASRWGDAVAMANGRALIGAIWSRETAIVGGDRLVVASAPAAGAQATQPTVVDDSALAPYAYRMFSVFDPGHPWLKVVGGTYHWLERLRLDPAVGGPVGVVPHLVVVDATGGVAPVGGTLGGSRFDAAASTLQWRLGLDMIWNGEGRAQDVLEWLGVPRRTVEAGGAAFASYNLDGMATGPGQGLMTSSTVLPSLFASGGVDLASRAFSSTVLTPALAARPGELDATSLGWAWFATALMDGGLANLTQGEATIDWARPGLVATAVVVPGPPPGPGSGPGPGAAAAPAAGAGQLP